MIKLPSISLFILVAQPLLSQVGLTSNPSRTERLQELKAELKEIPDDQVLSDADFITAKQLYLSMIQSATYQASREAMQKFVAKKPWIEKREDMEDGEAFRQWMVWNLADTKFESVEQAVQMRQFSIDLMTKQFEENKELYALLRCSSIAQVREIIKPEMDMERRRYGL